jgi:ubiquinone/menaquinone biosynthesis C-methylase UbiE
MKMDKSKIAVNTYNKIANAYTKEYFNDFSDIPYIDKFLGMLSAKAKILDIGSGPGQFSKHIKAKGFNVSGIDYSDKMVAIARSKVPNVIFQKMDMRKLEFGPETFDALLVSYSLIHIQSSEIPATLKGFNRVLKPRGYIEVIAQKGKANQIVDEPFMPTEKMFFNFFTKDRISKFLEKSGFEVVFQDEKPTQDPNSVGNKIIYTIAIKVQK